MPDSMALAVLNICGVTFSGVVCASAVAGRTNPERERRTVRVGVEVGKKVVRSDKKGESLCGD